MPAPPNSCGLSFVSSLKNTIFETASCKASLLQCKDDKKVKIIPFAATILQRAATVKEISVPFEDSEMIIYFLNGLPDRSDSLL